MYLYTMGIAWYAESGFWYSYIYLPNEHTMEARGINDKDKNKHCLFHILDPELLSLSLQHLLDQLFRILLGLIINITPMLRYVLRHRIDSVVHCRDGLAQVFRHWNIPCPDTLAHLLVLHIGLVVTGRIGLDFAATGFDRHAQDTCAGNICFRGRQTRVVPSVAHDFVGDDPHAIHDFLRIGYNVGIAEQAR